MKSNYAKIIPSTILTGMLLFTSCHSTREVSNYEITQSGGSRICMDSTWDNAPDEKVANILMPYKPTSTKRCIRLLELVP